MDNKIIPKKFKEFDTSERRAEIKNTWSKYDQFIKKFPFKENKNLIDQLAESDIYNPANGEKDYFFTWVEHKLIGLGAISVGSSNVYKNAANNLNTFKQLIKDIVDDSLSVHQKIDNNWGDIKGFGGDRLIAKKILFLYNPESIIPAYKTDDLEEIATSIGLDFRSEAYEKFGEDYELLSVGKKFELFCDLLLGLKNQYPELSKIDNCYLMWFLYTEFPVSRIQNRTQGNNHGSAPIRKLKPFSPLGLIAEPKYEQEVVFLFSKYHIKLGFPLITKIAPAFPDAEVLDDKGRQKKIEFEVFSSDFLSHGHDPKGCDFILCWEDNLSEEQKLSKGLPPIISLKDELSN
jgi:hypothetical protein